MVTHVGLAVFLVTLTSYQILHLVLLFIAGHMLAARMTDSFGTPALVDFT